MDSSEEEECNCASRPQLDPEGENDCDISLQTDEEQKEFLRASEGSLTSEDFSKDKDKDGITPLRLSTINPGYVSSLRQSEVNMSRLEDEDEELKRLRIQHSI